MKLPLAAAGLLLTLCAGAATGGEDAAKTPAGTAVNAPVPEGQAAQVHAAEAPAAEVQVARQKHSIQPCQGDDKRCARAWYGEYKAGILAELKHYRGLAGEIRRLHQAQDAAGAKALLDRLVAGGYYKHDEWDFPKDPAVPIAGVSSADVGAIGDCRVAIASLRLYLVDAAKQGGDFDDDWKSYNEFWRKCAKHYKLK